MFSLKEWEDLLQRHQQTSLQLCWPEIHHIPMSKLINGGDSRATMISLDCWFSTGVICHPQPTQQAMSWDLFDCHDWGREYWKTILRCIGQPLPEERSISFKISVVLRLRNPDSDQAKSFPGAGAGATFLEAHAQGEARISVWNQLKHRRKGKGGSSGGEIDAGEAINRVDTRRVDWVYQFSRGPKESLERLFFCCCCLKK